MRGGDSEDCVTGHWLQGQEEPPGGGSPLLSGVEGRSPLGVPEPTKQKLSKFTTVEKHLPSLFLIKLPTLTLGLHSTI